MDENKDFYREIAEKDAMSLASHMNWRTFLRIIRKKFVFVLNFENFEDK